MLTIYESDVFYVFITDYLNFSIYKVKFCVVLIKVFFLAFGFCHSIYLYLSNLYLSIHNYQTICTYIYIHLSVSIHIHLFLPYLSVSILLT